MPAKNEKILSLIYSYDGSLTTVYDPWSKRQGN